MRQVQEANSIKKFKGRGDYFDPSKVNDYSYNIGRYLKFLIALSYLIANILARGTEFISIKIRNIQYTIRNLIIQGGDLIILIEYIKTQNIIGNSIFIVRFLSIEISQLFITFIVDVQPFLSFLYYSVKQEDTTRSPFIQYYPNSKPLKTEAISKVLSEYTLKYLKVSLTIQSQRYFTIAIDRDIIREGNILDIKARESVYDL